jgi:hypothetical protein
VLVTRVQDRRPFANRPVLVGPANGGKDQNNDKNPEDNSSHLFPSDVCNALNDPWLNDPWLCAGYLPAV